MVIVAGWTCCRSRPGQSKWLVCGYHPILVWSAHVGRQNRGILEREKTMPWFLLQVALEVLEVIFGDSD